MVSLIFNDISIIREMVTPLMPTGTDRTLALTSGFALHRAA